MLKVNPNHYKAKVNLAIIQEKEGKAYDAQGNYEAALKLKPNESRIFHNLGINQKR